ncbi:hypothetical protein BcepF1.007 [Burkholderia phage BcepF1]|uniref:Uncharacterized protein n=1 Tax=Burkholderia phage BcepF1 TaxID=2886897 RepID=A1YZR1_9CAUD|nr:hypothetical protein BcepF1.007 [Burkholderia phage BcepF1]ABL96738.1 hypothetical protein BcepF1.007 [Burkholderia phage BcepF1]
MKPRRRFHCRCRKCDRRRVFRDNPEKVEAKLFPRCECGKRDWRLDKWMNNRDTGKTRCDCAGYSFPHRMSTIYCWHRKDGSDRLPGHEDFWTRDMTQEQHDELVRRYDEDVTA